jgi:hypothetical protein
MFSDQLPKNLVSMKGKKHGEFCRHERVHDSQWSILDFGCESTGGANRDCPTPMRFLTADTGREDRKIEPSGVAPIGDGSLLLVACDKNTCLSVVDAATGRIKQSFSVGVFDNRPKWEDLAHDDEGAYYVIGSRFVEEPAEEGTQKRLMAVPRLLRFRLRSDGAGGTPIVIDSESIVEWDIGDALAAEGYHRDPRKNEVNIEGLTVRTLREKAGQVKMRELVVGMREPHNPIRFTPLISLNYPPRTPSLH